MENPWEQLDRVGRLEENWDGHGAAEPTGRAFRWAKKIIGLLDPSVLPQTIVVPAAHGGIQLEWHYNNKDLEVEIGPNGDLAIYSEWEATAENVTEEDLKGITRVWINDILTTNKEMSTKNNE